MAEAASTNWPLKGEETQAAVPIAGNPFPLIACTREYFIIYSPSDVSVFTGPSRCRATARFSKLRHYADLADLAVYVIIKKNPE